MDDRKDGADSANYLNFMPSPLLFGRNHHSGHIESLKKENESLKQKIEDVSNEFQRSKASIEAMKIEITSLRNAKVISNEEKEKLAEQLREKSRRYNEITGNIKKRETALDQSRNELAEFKNKYLVCEKYLDEAREETSKVKNELSKTKTDYQSCKDKYTICKENYSKVQMKLSDETTRHSNLKKEYHQITDDNQRLTEKCEQYSKRQDEISSKIVDIRKERNTLKNDIVDIMKERDTLKDEIVEIRKGRDTLKDKIVIVRKERDTLKDEIVDIGKERDTLKDEIVDIGKERDTIKDEIVDIGKERDTLKDEIVDIRKERNTLKDDLLKVTKDAEKTAEENCLMTQEIYTLKSNVSELKESVSHFKKENSALKSKIEAQKLLSVPWRTMIEWTGEHLEDLKTEIENFRPFKKLDQSVESLQYVNILLLGPIGAGKSSFFNTVDSYFRGRIAMRARSGTCENSLTKKFRKYSVLSRQSLNCLGFQICDMCGISDDKSTLLRDIISITEGHISDGYTLNSSAPISKDCPKYVKNPQLSDVIHCVVIVLDACNLSDDSGDIMSDVVKEAITNIQERLNDKDIPQLVLLNKIDCVCAVSRQSISNVFHSQIVGTAVKKVAETLGLPVSAVMPMKCLNVEQGNEISTDVGILTLENLRTMLFAANDYLSQY